MRNVLRQQVINSFTQTQTHTAPDQFLHTDTHSHSTRRSIPSHRHTQPQHQEINQPINSFTQTHTATAPVINQPINSFTQTHTATAPVTLQYHISELWCLACVCTNKVDLRPVSNWWWWDVIQKCYVLTALWIVSYCTKSETQNNEKEQKKLLRKNHLGDMWQSMD